MYLISPGSSEAPLLLNKIGTSSTAPEFDDSALKILSAPAAGRFLAAAREIRPGETVLVEKPLAVVPLPDRAGSRCHHCLVR